MGSGFPSCRMLQEYCARPPPVDMWWVDAWHAIGNPLMPHVIDLTDPQTRAQLAPAAANGEKAVLTGLSKKALAVTLVEAGVPVKQARMRASQLWHWLYVRGVSDFDAMTNISRDLRTMLAERFTIARPEITAEQISQDGTRKWLMRFPSRGAGKPVEVETVYIP